MPRRPRPLLAHPPPPRQDVPGPYLRRHGWASAALGPRSRAPPDPTLSGRGPRRARSYLEPPLQGPKLPPDLQGGPRRTARGGPRGRSSGRRHTPALRGTNLRPRSPRTGPARTSPLHPQNEKPVDPNPHWTKDPLPQTLPPTSTGRAARVAGPLPSGFRTHSQGKPDLGPQSPTNHGRVGQDDPDLRRPGPLSPDPHLRPLPRWDGRSQSQSLGGDSERPRGRSRARRTSLVEPRGKTFSPKTGGSRVPPRLTQSGGLALP